MNYFASLGIFMRQGRKITAREETEKATESILKIVIKSICGIF